VIEGADKSQSELQDESMELYRAHRDFLEPRPRIGKNRELWRADAIVYSGNGLPYGELCRSIGHWNPSNQIEIFEVLDGEVLMVVQSNSGPLEVIACAPGSTWIMPAGSFHLTYALRKSLVVNIYNAMDMSIDEEKYRHRMIPSVFLSLGEHGISVVQALPTGVSRLDVSAYPPFTCRSTPLPVGRLHSLDDDEFFLNLSETP
jgi:hypothetical protein